MIVVGVEDATGLPVTVWVGVSVMVGVRVIEGIEVIVGVRVGSLVGVGIVINLSRASAVNGLLLFSHHSCT